MERWGCLAAGRVGRRAGTRQLPCHPLTDAALLFPSLLSNHDRYLNTDFDTYSLERKVGDFHCPANNRKDILDDGGCTPDNTKFGEPRGGWLHGSERHVLAERMMAHPALRLLLCTH